MSHFVLGLFFFQLKTSISIFVTMFFKMLNDMSVTKVSI